VCSSSGAPRKTPDEAVDRRRVGHVAGHRDGVAAGGAHFLCDCLDLVGQDVGQRDRRALAGERERRKPPHAARGARDHGDASVEAAHIAVYPMSTLTFDAVIRAASSEARKRTTFVTSWGSSHGTPDACVAASISAIRSLVGFAASKIP